MAFFFRFSITFRNNHSADIPISSTKLRASFTFHIDFYNFTWRVDVLSRDIAVNVTRTNVYIYKHVRRSSNTVEMCVGLAGTFGLPNSCTTRDNRHLTESKSRKNFSARASRCHISLIEQNIPLMIQRSSEQRFAYMRYGTMCRLIRQNL